jgi:hypothetical protein
MRMWTYDDIVRRNPAGKGQRASILARLLQIRAANQELLCETSDELEARTQSSVCCFAQLPFPISVEPSEYVIRGTTPSVFVHLEFRLFSLDVDSNGETQLAYVPVGKSAVRDSAHLGTQIRAFVPLWGRRQVYYTNYEGCLGDDGLEDRIISTAAWDPDHAPAAYRGKVVTAHAFESELASRVAVELRYVLRKFLVTYSVVSLDELPEVNGLHGCFLLASPGRIVYGNPPEPVLRGMLGRHSLGTPIDKARIDQGLQFQLREIDRYLHQLLAMQRLAKQGEPELAIVGCVTAIEWFMNSFVQRSDTFSLSMRACLKIPPFDSLSGDLRNHLRRLADVRNAIVHGEPPARHSTKAETAESESPLGISEIVRTGLSLYREMNLRRLRRHLQD